MSVKLLEANYTSLFLSMQPIFWLAEVVAFINCIRHSYSERPRRLTEVPWIYGNIASISFSTGHLILSSENIDFEQCMFPSELKPI